MMKKLAVFGTSFLVVLAVGIMCNAAELLKTTDFKGGVSLPWHISESFEQNSWSEVRDGKYTIHMDQKGVNKWDVQIRHREISILSGHKYNVKFSVTAKKDCMIYARIGDMGEPYGDLWNNNWHPYNLKAGETLNAEDTFVANKDSKYAEFAFHLGGELAGELPNEISFVSMSLDDPDFVPTPTPSPTPYKDIRVNQLGYFPNGIKKATLKVASMTNQAVGWNLKNSEGDVVASGKTIPFGPDHAAGETTQIIDFSSYTVPGKDYRLAAGNAESFPFDIGTDMYTQMKNDALKYFYHARSGVEIKMPYCVESKWARPAGHPNDQAALITGKNYIGPSSINGTGGWYDAGDHGKYVVNGGLALWIMQNQYEHSKASGLEDTFGDGKLNIPESGNGTNDLLDESRWEMEWMLKMQIPEGYDRAGMAADKVADEIWTTLPLRPDQDKQKRIYYPPSTAATLNLAACAAQAARIWKDIDPEFSERCFAASQTAYEAAKENPAIFALSKEVYGSTMYGDNYLQDEFYWAACELYVTTGNPEYLLDLKEYKNSLKIPFSNGDGEYNGIPVCFDWFATGGLGTLTLALHKSSEFSDIKVNVINTANALISIQKNESYGIPLAETTYINDFYGGSEEISGYPHASNSFVLNEAIVMAYAYDLSKDIKYINALTESIDYLMGRNPIYRVYVSGYGEYPVQHPHHRFFCPQFFIPDYIDTIYPSVPPGFIVGGPYSGIHDPWASSGNPFKCASQQDYLDYPESWDTNSVSISWNASLAWVTYYLDAFGKEIPVQPFYTPTNTPTNTQTPTNFRIPEDLNNDGVINMADVVIIAFAFNSTWETDLTCDLNNDGAVNMTDVMRLALKFGVVYRK
ncbi:glycoside hydrolase family 9 protein [Pseudobacteroides cellulosolvens]|uniref:Cellulose 1,4-beta-cellobiosidase n=1 Tax=Pseudobacteroides cellulosolvens ATCC 35603 = DSM 2933 TaxID=398512 RepID=A0A0L6JRD3_9FIRM|nr:glycoside hydrolase family 9 protein [Pseudobacteroides cellulosolvens]KNY28339.1 Cellulose 1,4-beta-cellobiosidase [Pseudobacteroides cellulosolvens ATCC 35603 = DSM 2933]